LFWLFLRADELFADEEGSSGDLKIFFKLKLDPLVMRLEAGVLSSSDITSSSLANTFF